MPRPFISSPADFSRIRKATPARLEVGHAGPRYTTAALLDLRADHARAVDAVREQLPAGWAKRHGMMEIHSRAISRQDFLRRPDLGRQLAPADAARLRSIRASGGNEFATVMLCVGDGLSSAAVGMHAPTLMRALQRQLRKSYRPFATPLFIRNARVRVQDHIGEIARPDVIVLLIGERPGLATAESLSAYVMWRPCLKSAEPDRSVISNIHPGGLRIPAAAAKIAQLVGHVIEHRASGAKLAAILSSREL